MHISNRGEWWHTHTRTRARARTHTHTHTHTQLRWKSVECLLYFFPILASSPRESQEQWAAIIAAPGDQVPSPVLVRDRTEEHLFFCMFLLLWGSMGEPRWRRGEHANTTQKGPGTSPDMLHHAGLEPTTFLLWGNSATHWATVPPTLFEKIVKDALLNTFRANLDPFQLAYNDDATATY